MISKENLERLRSYCEKRERQIDSEWDDERAFSIDEGASIGVHELRALIDAIDELGMYRRALSCERCKGWHRKLTNRLFRKPSGDVELEEYWEECPDCKEAREKARSNR